MNEQFLKERRLKLREEFSEKGVARVSAELQSGQINGEFDLADAREWLAEQELLSSAKRDEREEIILSIAKEANEIARQASAIADADLKAAREQARWAKWAAIIATIAAITANKENIISFFLNG